MASSLKAKRIYDVFLSFRGKDVRNNFIGHLYKALVCKGIYTFHDSEELRKGDQILQVLMNAIEESCIAIIIFSKYYASSKWCLEELAKIMECKERNDLTVLPVFYKVEPRDVRGGRKSYGAALAKHESKFGKDSENVKRWKKALFDAGSLSGWPLNDEDESEFIRKIVEEISIRIDRKLLHVAKHPIGIDSQVVELQSMLNLESDDGVLMMGLWGQGGIGKTTLAKALYNAIYGLFEGSCFLANVREASKDGKSLVSLQEKLLSEILALQQTLIVSNIDRGMNLIGERLHCKKVLLILDDVDNLRQLNALVGEGKWFGNGSRIIVTTRDKHLLTQSKIDHVSVYEVKPMGYNEARELLSKHAFPTHQQLKIKTALVDGVLDHAKGLPLALEVLGSFLCGRREDEWESTLDKISMAPNEDINDVLKISYEGLEATEKEIFLHIACFFKWWEVEYIKKVLNSCGYKATIGLQILSERSLLRTELGFLQMHDLIQLMGMDIVNQESNDPWRRSRLWLCDDVLDVLSHDMGDCAVKAIVLQPPEPKEIYIAHDAFTKMRKLRLLILHNVHNSFKGHMCIPNELRWFRWDGCAQQTLEFSAGEKKLMGLDLSNCSIPIVKNQFKDFQKLKHITLTNCKTLVSSPDVSCTPNLEELCLMGCQSLVEAHESIAYHDKLQVLHIEKCFELSVFPNVLKSKNLQHLRIHMCPKFERFPDIPDKLEGLKCLELHITAIKELSASIENLCSLESMSLYQCNNLITLPFNIYKLQDIKKLKIDTCLNFIGLPKYEKSAGQRMKIGLSKLQVLHLVECDLSNIEFLDDLSYFPLLRKLVLRHNDIISLPTSISKCYHLSLLDIRGCDRLQEIPKLPPYLNELHAEMCKSLQTNGHLTSIHQWVHRGLTMVDIASFAQNSSCFISLLGGEMPAWFQYVKEGSISFMASKELYDKFLGLVFCGVHRGGLFSLHTFGIVAHFNGNRQHEFTKIFNSGNSYNMCLCYCPPSDLWDKVDFGRIDGNYAQFSLTVSGAGLEKLGFRIICKQLEDDLKVEIRDNQLIDPAFLYEVGHDLTDSEAESSYKYAPNSPIEIDLLRNFQDCQMSTGQHGQRGLKRKHEFSLPQGKRTKTMLASNQPMEMRMTDLLKSLHL